MLLRIRIIQSFPRLESRHFVYVIGLSYLRARLNIKYIVSSFDHNLRNRVFVRSSPLTVMISIVADRRSTYVSESLFEAFLVVRQRTIYPAHPISFMQTSPNPIHSTILHSSPNATPISNSHPHSQLHIIIHQPHLLARFKRRQPNIRTAITAKRISQRAIATRAHFALHREVHLRQVFGLQLGEVVVCLRALGGVFGIEPLGEATAAVLAGAAALGVGEACFGCW